MYVSLPFWTNRIIQKVMITKKMLVIENTKPASNHIESEQKSGLLIKYASLNSQ